MQTFKITRSQLGKMMRQFNIERKQSLKNIKSFYSQIQSKQHHIFDTTLQRLTQNLSNFKSNKYQKLHHQINHQLILSKYQHKLTKIDKQIIKIDQIIKNGCGKIVQKPLTSRISSISHTHTNLGSQSRRSIQSSSKLEKTQSNIEKSPSNMDSTLMYLKSPNIENRNTLDNLDTEKQ